MKNTPSQLLRFGLPILALLFLFACEKNNSDTENNSSSAKESADIPVPPQPVPAVETTLLEQGDYFYNFWNELGAHPLDVALKQCAEENPGDAGSRTCIVQFLDKWDAELNRVYKSLTGMLSEAQLPGLKSSQRAWIPYRDAEFAFIESKYAGMQGTMFGRIVSQEKLMVVRHRALELTAYDTALGVDR